MDYLLHDDIDAFYPMDPMFYNPFAHFLMLKMGMVAPPAPKEDLVDKNIQAHPLVCDKGTQTETKSIIWSYFH